MASKLTPRQRRIMRARERAIESLLFLAAASSVLVTVGIVLSLLFESARFFAAVPPGDYVVEAERLGYRSVFLVEHHFTGVGQLSASLNFLSYLAGRTRRIRLGTAVMLLGAGRFSFGGTGGRLN